MFGYFANNKYEKFATNDDSRIQRIFDAESKALTQINSTSESAAANIKQKTDDASSQINKSTNDATQQIIGKINDKYNEVEQKIPLLTKDGIDKTVKQVVDNVIKDSEPIAKNLVRDLTGVYNYGKTNYNQSNIYENISKNVPKNISTNKTTSSLIFLVFVVFVGIFVFEIYKFKYDTTYANELINSLIAGTTKPSSKISSITTGLIRIALICGAIMLSIVIFKEGVLKKSVSSKDALDIITSVAIISVPIIGITMITIENMPLMLRSFENTIGYLWINGSNLSECTKALFNEKGNYNDYSIITTQLFEENFTYYLTCMKQNYKAENDAINLNRFQNVFLNDSFFNGDKLNFDKLKEPDNELHKLLEFVVKKRFISNMSWIAFSAIYVLYVCNLKLLQ